MARILIVDDEEKFRPSLKEILEFAGYEVLEAGDGQIYTREVLDAVNWLIKD